MGSRSQVDCVIVAAEPCAVEQKSGRKLSANQQTMLSILHDAGKDGLLLSDWNEKAKAQGIGTKRPASLYDAQKALKDAKLANNYGDRWWANA